MITNADRDDALEGVEEGKTVSQDHARSSGSVTSGHTPGPWLRSGCRQKVGGSDTHSVVATVDGEEIIIASVWYNPQTHEGFRDAGLIAAAPELLEHLRFAVKLLSPWVGGSAQVEAMRAAIAKATGLPPSSAEQIAGQVPGTNTETQLSTGEQP